MRIAVCINCLTVKSGMLVFPVGREKGDQRDSWQTTIDLCEECADALETGNMPAFHERYNPHPSVKVKVR